MEPKLGGYDAIRSRETRRAILERLRATPGVELATTTTIVPFGDFSISGYVQREGPRLKPDDPDASGKLVSAMQYEVGTDYFRTLGLSMLKGREFTPAEETDAARSIPVIICRPGERRASRPARRFALSKNTRYPPRTPRSIFKRRLEQPRGLSTS